MIDYDYDSGHFFGEYIETRSEKTRERAAIIKKTFNNRIRLFKN